MIGTILKKVNYKSILKQIVYIHNQLFDSVRQSSIALEENV